MDGDVYSIVASWLALYFPLPKHLLPGPGCRGVYDPNYQGKVRVEPSSSAPPKQSGRRAVGRAGHAVPTPSPAPRVVTVPVTLAVPQRQRNAVPVAPAAPRSRPAEPDPLRELPVTFRARLVTGEEPVTGSCTLTVPRFAPSPANVALLDSLRASLAAGRCSLDHAVDTLCACLTALEREAAGLSMTGRTSPNLVDPHLQAVSLQAWLNESSDGGRRGGPAPPPGFGLAGADDFAFAALRPQGKTGVAAGQ